MFFNSKDFEVINHGAESILKINYMGKDNFPSIEDDGFVMRDTIKKLSSSSNITKIIFVYNKNYEYDFECVKLLKEIHRVYEILSKDKNLFKIDEFSKSEDTKVKDFFSKYSKIQSFIMKDLLSDPIGTFVKIKREIRNYEFDIKYKNESQNENYSSALNYIYEKIGSLTIVKKSVNELEGYSIGDRKIYSKFFKANIKPNFIYTSLQKQIPYDAYELDSYRIDSGLVRIFHLNNKAYNLYHLTPIEFELNEDEYMILNLAKEVISEHSPESSDFIDPDKLREVFFNIAKDLISEISQFKKIDLPLNKLDKLANVLIRYTIGFGLVEVLLEDESIQDISVNSPSNKTPIFITHSNYEDCITNIVPEYDEVESWASRLRMISGKPLDAANPLLDTEIETPKARARVSVVSKPLNPYGLGFSFRRHRDKPWTLPLFIKNKMISPLGAGLLSFLVDGARTILIAGTRGSGKSSFLTALMIEIMRKYRIITIEDSVYKNSKILVKYNNKTYNIEIEKFFNILKRRK